MRAWERIIHRVRKDKEIVIVSGLPRSGTSMMMKMLETGGIPVLTDYQRTADADNPRGYYEFERVKKLKDGDTEWLPDARGKAVKVISALLEHLPGDYRYRVLFMHRSLPEILASQRRMLVNRSEDPEAVTDDELAGLYERHLQKVEAWLARQRNMAVLYLNYNDLVEHPEPGVIKVNNFLGGGLATEKMLGVIDPGLYRQRQGSGAGG
jgi:hypothetical protein